MTCSSTEIPGSRWYCWNTKPIVLFRKTASSFSPIFAVSFPPILTMPPVGRSRQPIMFMHVDFPEPEGPIIERNSPRFTAKEMPRSAWTCSSPIEYVFVTSCIKMTCSAMPNSSRQNGGRPPPIGAAVPLRCPLLLCVLSLPLFCAELCAFSTSPPSRPRTMFT